MVRKAFAPSRLSVEEETTNESTIMRNIPSVPGKTVAATGEASVLAAPALAPALGAPLGASALALASAPALGAALAAAPESLRAVDSAKALSFIW